MRALEYFVFAERRRLESAVLNEQWAVQDGSDYEKKTGRVRDHLRACIPEWTHGTDRNGP